MHVPQSHERRQAGPTARTGQSDVPAVWRKVKTAPRFQGQPPAVRSLFRQARRREGGSRCEILKQKHVMIAVTRNRALWLGFLKSLAKVRRLQNDSEQICLWRE